MTFDDAAAKSQDLVDRYHRGELTREAYLERLRHDYHSVHASVRSQAVHLLDHLAEPERTRELIQLFYECQWRGTQIAIVRTLATQPTQRGLEFLIHLVADNADLGLCREAITALGHSRASLAARYLVRRYTAGPPSLKPYVAHALGELLDRTLVGRFVEDLKEAVKSQQVLWIQSLVLALAELKVGECVDDLVGLLQARPRSIALSALLALGKLAREPAILDQSTSGYEDDFVEWQILAGARHQIVLRSRWSIEDYLEKLFDLEETLHPGLALDLNNFSAEEVREGLEIFRDETHRVRLAEVLAVLHHPEAIAWYQDLLDPESATDDELKSILVALQSRAENAFESLLLAWRERCVMSQDDDLYEAWLRTCALTLSEGGRVIAAFMLGETFADQSPARKITAINQFVDHALSALGDNRHLKTIVRGLEALLAKEKEQSVVGRILRAFAQIRIAGPKVVGFARKHLEDRGLLLPILQFFRFCSHPRALDWLTKLVTKAPQRREIAAALLYAMAAQKGGATSKHAELDEFLDAALKGDYGQEARLAALDFLTRHPRPSLFEGVLDLLSAGDRVRVVAIVALKSFSAPRTTPRLVPFLNDDSESTVGRALDTLTAQPDDQARWAILEFLEERIDDVDLVDKVIRCLTPPKRDRQGFFDRIGELVEAHPHHELLEGLIQLRDRVAPPERSPLAKGELPEGVDPELDRGLEKRLDVFTRLDERVKAALRSAELPYFYPDVFHGEVDKSTSILEYCKAVDLFLERHFGYELLLPKLRDDHPAFQNTVYRAGLNEHYPNPVFVIDELGLQGLVSPEALPITKMVRVAQSVLDGRIQHAQWKILDGLRAWSATLLLFVRSADGGTTHNVPIPIRLSRVSNRMIVELALHLDRLQALRNPVAHRRTLVEFADIETIRNDIADIFAILGKVFLAL
jgi:HEAT repeat protein